MGYELKIQSNMREIIPVKTGKLALEVNSRGLHNKLGSKQQYADWIKRRIGKYGFVEDVDFFISLRKSSGGRRQEDYIVTLDMAKELAMLEHKELIKKQ
jgi:phage anti-repressor protein